MGDYFNAHAHSIYSIRDSIAKIEDMADKVLELNLHALCITDHGTVGASLVQHSIAQERGIKAIYGCEIYVATRSRHKKEKGIDKYYHLTLLAMNEIGWKNLVHLVSEGYNEENFYYKPRVDRELLRKYNEGLIVLSGCIGGNLSNAIMKDLNISFIDEEGNTTLKTVEEEEVYTGEYFEDVIKWHKKVFGDRYYLEVQNHHMGEEEKINDVIFEMGKKYDIKVIATGDTHFVDESDHHVHNIMLAIRDGCTIHDDKFKPYTGDGYHMMGYDGMLERFTGHEEVLSNSMEILERCNVDFSLHNSKLPHLRDIKVEDEEAEFYKKVYEGLHNRFGKDLSTEIIERAEYEMKIIIQMVFPSYFLIVSDYIRYAKSQGILVGPGRGSAAGSLVSYALEITNVNPLDYGLSFSRFLNKGRAAVPQIDFPEYAYADWRTKQIQTNNIAESIS